MSRFSSGQIRVQRDIQDFERRGINDLTLYPVISGVKPKVKKIKGTDITRFMKILTDELPKINTPTEQEKNKKILDEMSLIINRIKSMRSGPRIIQPLRPTPMSAPSVASATVPPVAPPVSASVSSDPSAPMPQPIPQPMPQDDRINLLRMYDAAVDAYNNGLDISPIYNTFSRLSSAFNILNPMAGSGLDKKGHTQKPIDAYWGVSIPIQQNRFTQPIYDVYNPSQLQKYSRDPRTVMDITDTRRRF